MFGRVVFYIYVVYFIGNLIFVATSSLSLDGDVLFESNLEALKRVTRQTKKCGTREFKCKSGQCINEDNQCDGLDHCKDGSDETAETCRSVPCPPYLFRCAYGACINGDAECDGKKDCKDNSDETSPKCKNKPINPSLPSNTCGPNSFQCNSGECIDDLDLCDGIKTCRDGSDESIEACSNVDCPGFTFRCSYGGCVSKEARCNGQVECIDGSDEQGCTTINPPVKPPSTPPNVGPTPVTPSVLVPNSCPMPEQPIAGNYHIGGSGISLSPGDSAPPSTALTYRCRPGFKLGKNELNTTYCFDGQWIPGIPQCKQVCPPFNSPKLEVQCTLDRATIDCDYAVTNTIAQIKCVANYEDLQISENPFRFCQDGTWDSNPPNCIPVCGEKKTNAQELTIGGKVTVVGEYPWQVAIYHNRKNICGGTLVTTRLVISAAHCFKSAKTQYEVGAGKHYNDYNSDQDTEAQFSTLEEVFIPSEYRGAEQNHQFDIAVLVLKSPVKFTQRVQPICMDWQNRFEREQLFDNNLGVVTGWGYTEVGSTPSPELKKLQVPYISNSECKKSINPDNYKFLTFDKFCAGYLNGSSVCQGDSGGGLVFRQAERGRYYLRGVVSIGPKSAGNTCDPYQYTFYTLVSKHMDYIVQQRGKYRDIY